VAKIRGVQVTAKRLRSLTDDKARDITAALYNAGQEIELEAERSITQGSVSGKNHVASLPGQPPNADTRFLDTNIETRIVSSRPPKVVVESLAPYSAALEYGTSRMQERPFMRPAVAKKRKRVGELVAKALKS
jgi:HK97 gp10 family phage protein